MVWLPLFLVVAAASGEWPIVCNRTSTYGAGLFTQISVDGKETRWVNIDVQTGRVRCQLSSIVGFQYVGFFTPALTVFDSQSSSLYACLVSGFGQETLIKASWDSSSIGSSGAPAKRLCTFGTFPPTSVAVLPSSGTRANRTGASLPLVATYFNSTDIGYGLINTSDCSISPVLGFLPAAQFADMISRVVVADNDDVNGGHTLLLHVRGAHNNTGYVARMPLHDGVVSEPTIAQAYKLVPPSTLADHYDTLLSDMIFDDKSHVLYVVATFLPKGNNTRLGLPTEASQYLGGGGKPVPFSMWATLGTFDHSTHTVAVQPVARLSTRVGLMAAMHATGFDAHGNAYLSGFDTQTNYNKLYVLDRDTGNVTWAAGSMTVSATAVVRRTG